MSHGFSFFRPGFRPPGLPEDDPVRLFIRRYRKVILVVLGLSVMVALFFVGLAAMVLFKFVIPTLVGTANSETAQTGLSVITKLLAQLADANPLQWLSLILQAGS